MLNKIETIRIDGKDYPSNEVKINPDQWDGRNICVQYPGNEEPIPLYLDRDISYTFKGIRNALTSGFLQLQYDDCYGNMVVVFRKDVVDGLLFELNEGQKPHCQQISDSDYSRIIKSVQLCEKLVDYCSPCQDEFSTDDFDAEKIANLYYYRTRHNDEDTILQLSINGKEYRVKKDCLTLEVESHTFSKDEYICKGNLYNVAEDEMTQDWLIRTALLLFRVPARVRPVPWRWSWRSLLRWVSRLKCRHHRLAALLRKERDTALLDALSVGVVLGVLSPLRYVCLSQTMHSSII